MRMHLAASAAAASLVASSILFCAEAQAQMICGDRDDLGRMLDDRFGERPKGAGLAGERVVELLVSGTGSWTILITAPDGRSCVVTGGENWIDKPERPAPAGKGT